MHATTRRVVRATREGDDPTAVSKLGARGRDAARIARAKAVAMVGMSAGPALRHVSLHGSLRHGVTQRHRHGPWAQLQR